MTLKQYIDQVFAENGVIARLGGRVLKEQHVYALSVANTLELQAEPETNHASFLQADTGIGKSFGYLIPIMLHLSTSTDQQRFIISTYTRQLQKQIFSEDIPFIRKILQELGLPNNHTVAFRMGKKAFFSPARVQRICNRIKLAEPNRKQEMEAFIFNVKDICEYGSGLWTDYIEEFGELPRGILADDVCLLQHQTIDNPAFSLHLDKIESASVIITNHHSLLHPETTKLNTQDINTVIVDEAHKLSGICQDMFNHHLSLNDLKLTLKKTVLLKTLSKKALLALDVISKIELTIQNLPNFKNIDHIGVSNYPDLFKSLKVEVNKLNKHIKSIVGDFNQAFDSDALALEDAELLTRLSASTDGLERWFNQKDNSYQISTFSISPVQKKISIATINVCGSMAFGRTIKRITQKVLLTSATISDAKKVLSFAHLKNGLGLKSFETHEELSVSPRNYADLRFVLTDKGIPSPVASIDDNEVFFNTKWLNNTAKMIEAARKENGHLLVLTVSHNESMQIAKLLSKPDEISLHKKGHSIKEYLNDYKDGKTKVLITSAGWEGLNLRAHDKSQLIENIVITRIPFTPPNPLMSYALDLLSKTNPKIAMYRNNIEWVNSIQDVVAKIKQGLGRGTRAPDDITKIWFADSRMPHGMNERGNTVLLNAIPERFLPFFLDATIFEQKRKEVFFL